MCQIPRLVRIRWRRHLPRGQMKEHETQGHPLAMHWMGHTGSHGLAFQAQSLVYTGT